MAEYVGFWKKIFASHLNLYIRSQAHVFVNITTFTTTSQSGMSHTRSSPNPAKAPQSMGVWCCSIRHPTKLGMSSAVLPILLTYRLIYIESSMGHEVSRLYQGGEQALLIGKYFVHFPQKCQLANFNRRLSQPLSKSASCCSFPFFAPPSTQPADSKEA